MPVLNLLKMAWMVYLLNGLFENRNWKEDFRHAVFLVSNPQAGWRLLICGWNCALFLAFETKICPDK